MAATQPNFSLVHSCSSTRPKPSTFVIALFCTYTGGRGRREKPCNCLFSFILFPFSPPHPLSPQCKKMKGEGSIFVHVCLAHIYCSVVCVWRRLRRYCHNFHCTKRGGGGGCLNIDSASNTIRCIRSGSSVFWAVPITRRAFFSNRLSCVFLHAEIPSSFLICSLRSESIALWAKMIP